MNSMSNLSFIFGKKATVKAVEEHDFPAYLKKIGAYDDVVSGRQFCMSCGTRITIDNLQAVLPGQSGNVRFICENPSCLKNN